MKVFKFNPITHTYTLDGEKIPSVTSFIPYHKPLGVSKNSLNNAKDNGKNLHFDIEKYVKKQTIETEIQKMFHEWYQKFYLQNGKILLCETPFYMQIADKYIGGTPDYYFEKGTLVDFKSGISAGMDYFELQLGAYSELLKQNGYEVKRILILYPKAKKLSVIEIEPNLKGFIKLVNKKGD